MCNYTPLVLLWSTRIEYVLKKMGQMIMKSDSQNIPFFLFAENNVSWIYIIFVWANTVALGLLASKEY